VVAKLECIGIWSDKVYWQVAGNLCPGNPMDVGMVDSVGERRHDGYVVIVPDGVEERQGESYHY
jgi:hypothetical protein